MDISDLQAEAWGNADQFSSLRTCHTAEDGSIWPTKAAYNFAVNKLNEKEQNGQETE